MTLLIKNVNIVNGDEAEPRREDIFIHNDRISAIGGFPHKKAGEIIDGQGAYASAGFIDLHNESDHSLGILSHPSQDDFLKQGVTTIVGGSRGISLAPLLYGRLDSFGESADTRRMNVNWHTAGDFLNVLGKKKTGVNFGTLAGYATIREAIAGPEPRELTANEVLVISKLLDQAFREGLFGLSIDFDSRAGRFVSYKEFKKLAETVKKHHGVLSVRIRSEDVSLDDIFRLAKEVEVNILINDFVVKEEKGTNRIHSVVSPFGTDIFPLSYFLPQWMKKETSAAMRERLKDDWFRQKIIKDLPELEGENFIVINAVKNESLNGYSLKELSELYSAPNLKEALLALMKTTGLRCLAEYKKNYSGGVETALQHPRTLIGSHGASFSEYSSFARTKSMRETYPYYLAWVEEENILPINEAVRKITLEPAKLLGLKKRGEIKEGYFADLAVFKNGEIKFVIVNGHVAVRNGECENVRAGAILRK